MKLPCGECKGKCCTWPAFSEAEFQTVKYTKGVPENAVVIPVHTTHYGDSRAHIGGFGFLIHDGKGVCPYLQNGKCSIYEIRPKVCRDYGVIDALPCDFLYPEKARNLAAKRAKGIFA